MAREFSSYFMDMSDQKIFNQGDGTVRLAKQEPDLGLVQKGLIRPKTGRAVKRPWERCKEKDEGWGESRVDTAEGVRAICV